MVTIVSIYADYVSAIILAYLALGNFVWHKKKFGHKPEDKRVLNMDLSFSVQIVVSYSQKDWYFIKFNFMWFCMNKTSIKWLKIQWV